MNYTVASLWFMALVLVGWGIWWLNRGAQRRLDEAAERQQDRSEPTFNNSAPPIRQPRPPAPPPAQLWLLIGGPHHGTVVSDRDPAPFIMIAQGHGTQLIRYNKTHWRALDGIEELVFRMAPYADGVAPDHFAEVPDLIRRLNFLDIKGRAL